MRNPFVDACEIMRQDNGLLDFTEEYCDDGRSILYEFKFAEEKGAMQVEENLVHMMQSAAQDDVPIDGSVIRVGAVIRMKITSNFKL